jgi:transposase
MLFCGIDWAEEHHDVCVVDDEGRVRWRRRIEHAPGGIDELRAAVAHEEDDPAQVLVAIETGRGLLVAALLDAGYTVYPINPKSAERYRDRRSSSGGKNDRLDAEVLANAVRTDRTALRPLLSDSAQAVEIATLARDHARLTREQTRLRNQLRSALLEYYPAALVAFDDLGAKSALAFLQRYPAPEAAARLARGSVRRFLRIQHAHRDAEARATAIVTALRAPALRARPEIARAKARLVQTLTTQLLTLRPAMSDYERELERLLKAHPEGEIFLSFPGLGVTLASRVLAGTGDNASRFASGYGAYAGTAPIVIQSGKRRVVKARVACPKYFRDAVQIWADEARRHSPSAAAYYQRQIASGHGHNEATRALANELLKLLFTLRRRGCPFDEEVRLMTLRHAA